MTDDPKRFTRPTAALPLLPTLSNTDAQGEGCTTTCRSNDWIWDEEVALVRAMNAVKQRVRAARLRGDDETVRVLRSEFSELRMKMEKVRRRRLDSLGLFDYD